MGVMDVAAVSVRMGVGMRVGMRVRVRMRMAVRLGAGAGSLGGVGEGGSEGESYRRVELGEMLLKEVLESRSGGRELVVGLSLTLGGARRHRS